jgi:ribonuclease J
VARTYLDGTSLVGAFDGVVRDRIRLAINGLVVVALIVDEADDLLDDSWVAVRGLPERIGKGDVLSDYLEDRLADVLPTLEPKTVGDDDKLEEAVKRIVRQVCMAEVGKKPEVTVLISRLMA